MIKYYVKIVSLFLLVLFPGFCYSAPVKDDAAIAWVNDTGHRLIDALSTDDIDNKYAVLDNMFNNDIDLNYISRFVIGKYWREMNKEQQTEYVGLFSRYALSLYKSFPLEFDTKGLGFEVLSVKQYQKFTDVTCLIRLPEEMITEKIDSINVKFKLTQNNDKIMIVDLILGESSLLTTYRTRFYDMIKSLDYEMSWFLEDFTDMVISAEKTAQEKLGY